MSPTLESFQLKNFKAIQDTGLLKFGSFTLIVGGNGSGKSSLLEGLEVMHALSITDVDTIFNQPRWRGFHHVWNKATNHPLGPKKESPRLCENAMGFTATIHTSRPKRTYHLHSEVTQGEGEHVIVSRELVTYGKTKFERSANGQLKNANDSSALRLLDPSFSLLSTGLVKPFAQWQFLNLHAGIMGQPTSRLGTHSKTSLNSDGANLAEVLRKLSEDGALRLMDGLRQILGYAKGLHVGEFSAVDRTVYLKMKEGEFDVPGWLLSGGTLRLVAILACLYQDDPPPLLVIDEIENGLDPRTVGFLINQIREAVQAGRTQIIATTHSPHLLSQVELDHLLLCQRLELGEPCFWRPGDSTELKKWSEDFNPGDLYATGRIQKEMVKTLRRL
jgi:predicted ATPase